MSYSFFLLFFSFFFVVAVNAVQPSFPNNLVFSGQTELPRLPLNEEFLPFPNRNKASAECKAALNSMQNMTFPNTILMLLSSGFPGTYSNCMALGNAHYCTFDVLVMVFLACCR